MPSLTSRTPSPTTPLAAFTDAISDDVVANIAGAVLSDAIVIIPDIISNDALGKIPNALSSDAVANVTNAMSYDAVANTADAISCRVPPTKLPPIDTAPCALTTTLLLMLSPNHVDPTQHLFRLTSPRPPEKCQRIEIPGYC